MSQRDRYTKTIATLHVLAIEWIDGKPTATVLVEHCNEKETRLNLIVNDKLVFDYSPEVDAPDGKSLVRAAWAVLLDILGFKKVEAR